MKIVAIIDRTKAVLETARSIIISTAILILVVTITVVLVESFRERRPVLRPIRVPESLEKMGFTADSLTSMVANRVVELRRQAIDPRANTKKTAGDQPAPYLSGGVDPLEKLTLPGTDASLQMLVMLFNKFIGTSPPIIDVNIWDAGESYSFSLQYSGPSLPRSTDMRDLSGSALAAVKRDAISSELVEAIAQRVFWLVDPVSYARLAAWDEGDLTFYPSYISRREQQDRQRNTEEIAIELLTYCIDQGCSGRLERAQAQTDLALLALRWGENERAADLFTKAFQVRDFSPTPEQRVNFARALIFNDQPIPALNILGPLIKDKHPGDGAMPYPVAMPWKNSPFDQQNFNPGEAVPVDEINTLMISAYSRLLNPASAEALMPRGMPDFHRRLMDPLWNDLVIAHAAHDALRHATGDAASLAELDILGALLVNSGWSSIGRAMMAVTLANTKNHRAMKARLQKWQDIRTLRSGKMVIAPDLSSRWKNPARPGANATEQIVTMLDELADTAESDVAREAIEKAEFLLFLDLLSDKFQQAAGQDLPFMIKDVMARSVSQDSHLPDRPAYPFLDIGAFEHLRLWEHAEPSAQNDELGRALKILAVLAVSAVADKDLLKNNLDVADVVSAQHFEEAIDASRQLCGFVLPELYMADALISARMAREPIEASQPDLQAFVGAPTQPLAWDWFKGALCQPTRFLRSSDRQGVVAYRAIALLALADKSSDRNRAKEIRNRAIEAMRPLYGQIGAELRAAALLALGRFDEMLRVLYTPQYNADMSNDFLETAMVTRAMIGAGRVKEAVTMLEQSLDYYTFYGASQDYRPEILADALITTQQLDDAISYLQLAIDVLERGLPDKANLSDDWNGHATRYGGITARLVGLLCQTGQADEAKVVFQRGIGRFDGDLSAIRIDACWQ